MLYLIILLAADPQAVEVLGGVLIDKETNLEFNVGEGTFLPDPLNKQLAKDIIDKNALIEELELNIRKNLERSLIFEKKAHDTEQAWTRSYKRCELENIALKSWWNKNGKVVFWSILSAVVASAVTYYVTEHN